MDVEMKDVEKFPVDMAKGKDDLKNSKQGEEGGESKQQEELLTDDKNSYEEMEKDKENIENGAGGSIGNGMEEEKRSGADAVKEEKVFGENTEQCIESPLGNGTEANQSEQKGGVMVDEPDDKNVVAFVTADGNAGLDEMPENKDESGHNAKAENKDDDDDDDEEEEEEDGDGDEDEDGDDDDEYDDDGVPDILKRKNDANGQNDDTRLAADPVEPIVPPAHSWYTSGTEMTEEEETGTPEDQAAFMKELESFYKEGAMDFKPPKFYGQPLNCLKLYRAVVRLGGHERVTGSKLWRQVGESFNPPKTCTTVSWTFRIFYEKAILEYEKHKLKIGELQLPPAAVPDPITGENELKQVNDSQDAQANDFPAPGSGRARRDSAARAMQSWHSQRHNGYGEEKNLNNTPKREKSLKSIVKHKRPTEAENQHALKAARVETSKQLATTVVDVGPPADWVKINIREAKDCFEVYALVPGLLREEVRVQSDPAGRLVITGQPEQLDNPWGVSPFKKVVSLPARIDPLQTSAVVSLHGRLFVRVPFEQSNV